MGFELQIAQAGATAGSAANFAAGFGSFGLKPDVAERWQMHLRLGLKGIGTQAVAASGAIAIVDAKSHQCRPGLTTDCASSAPARLRGTLLGEPLEPHG